MVTAKLTDKQRSIYQFIQDRIVARGHAPTIREIGEAFGIRSTNGVRTHLTALIKKGLLKKQGFISRGLELARPLAGRVGRVPLVGSVPAGSPIDAIENIEGEIAVDFTFLPSGDSFSLRVRGESMKDAGILDGDVVLVKKQETALKGDIVVALIDGEATVKRYHPQKAKIILEPANEAFQPIVFERGAGDFRIAGKVVGLMRRLG